MLPDLLSYFLVIAVLTNRIDLTSDLRCQIIYLTQVCAAGTCPAGWQKYNENVCFSLMTNSSIWSESESACKAKGGQLASLNTLDEFHYVQAVCNIGAVNGCWVGGQEVSFTPALDIISGVALTEDMETFKLFLNSCVRVTFIYSHLVIIFLFDTLTFAPWIYRFLYLVVF